MPTFYVRYRKNGPVGVYSVVASNVESAKAAVARSALAGEEFDILDANSVGYEIVSATGPTGP